MSDLLPNLSVTDLRDKINALYKALSEHNLLQKSVLTFREAMAYMQISDSYLHKLTAARAIPHFKPGGKLVFFRRADLDAWMQSGYRPSAETLSAMARNIADQKSKKH